MRRIVALLVLVLFASAESQGQSSTDSLQIVCGSLVKDSIFKSFVLHGMEVVKMKPLPKGAYIVNGRKVVVK